ncbi:MAG: hypothetical protein DGJ47_000425 [Rickettsiaceae bacterium]
MISIDRANDKVIIIAPSSGMRDQEGRMNVEASFKQLENTVKLFRDRGFKCKHYDNIFTKNKLGYLAADKNIRSLHLKKALEDPQVKIIAAFRGGYGSGEIALESLNIKPLGEKILIGFSDITALHLLFNQSYKMPSIHGMVSANFTSTLSDLFGLLSGQENSYNLISLNALAKNEDSIEAEVTGGNLSVYNSMIGSKLSPNIKGKILVIEDVAEPGYKVHRMLLQLQAYGAFENIRAIIFGSFSQTDQFFEDSLHQFIADYLENVPCYQTDRIGHLENHPFVLGCKAQISNSTFFIKSPFKMI